MPYKFNNARRNKFPKAKYRVTNCSEYNESLRRRGDVTIWVSDDVVRNWASPRRKTRGGQSLYSDMAIEICLTLRVVWMCRVERRPPRLDLDVYPFLPRARVATTSPASYMCLTTGTST